MFDLYVDPEKPAVRRHELLVHDWQAALRGARRPGKQRSGTGLFRPLTGAKSQQTETLPQTGLAGGKGLQAVVRQPAAAKGSVLSKTATVKGVAGDVEPKSG